MSVRVDAGLCKRFERAAGRTQQTPEEIFRAFMHDFADRHLTEHPQSGIIPEGAINACLQIDLEDFLALPDRR